MVTVLVRSRFETYNDKHTKLVDSVALLWKIVESDLEQNVLMPNSQSVSKKNERFCCLPKGRHSEAAHEKRLLCAQKCTRGGGSCRGGVGWVM